MSAAIYVLMWFLAGIIGVFIGNLTDRLKDIPLSPNSVLWVAAGPAVLIPVIVGLTLEAK